MAVSLAFATALFLLLATACSPSGKPAALHRPPPPRPPRAARRLPGARCAVTGGARTALSGAEAGTVPCARTCALDTGPVREEKEWERKRSR